MRNSAIELLGYVFYQSGFSTGRIQYAKFNEERSKEEMIHVFTSFPITSIKVTELRGKSIPEEFKLFNPDFDKNLLYKQIFRDDASELDELEAQTDPNGNGDLRKTVLAKAAIQAGEPQVIKAVVHNDEKTFRRKQPDKFSEYFTTEQGDTVKEEDILRFKKRVTTEYFISRELLDDTENLGPLFDGLNHIEEHDD